MTGVRRRPGRRGGSACLAARLRQALLLLVMAGSAASAQSMPLPQGTTAATLPLSITGTVVAQSDGTPVMLAELRVGRTGVRARTDAAGAFRLVAAVGDSLLVRALGFTERRLVVTSPALRITLVPLATVLPVFTTTMGQRVIRASESPRSVTVISRKELEAVAAVSANQILRQLPGLQELPAPPSKTSISIRGFDDSRVLVLVDGEPVAGALMESRDIGRLSTIATERIEVTKGPSSVEFGSDALGGVINLVQAAPTTRLTIDAVARDGGLGRQESSVGVSQTVGKLGYRVNGGWRQSDRLTGYNAVGSTFNRIYDVRSDVRYALPNLWTLRLDMQGSQERQRFPVNTAFNGFIDNRGGQGFAEARGPLAGGNLRARAFVQRFVYQYRQSRGLLPIQGSADSLEQRERQERFLLSYTRVVGRHALDVGAQRSHRTLVAPRKVTGDSAAEQVTEVFARDAWTVGPVLLTAGARHTSSTLWGSSANPSIGVAWQASSGVRMRSNVARGFRAPGFKEIRYTFTNPAGGYTLSGNPDLLPESSWSTSLGGTWAPSTSLSIDVEAYRNDVSGLVDWRYEGDNAAGFQSYRYVNVARARTQGVELNAQGRVGATELTVGYDFLRARDLNAGLPLSRRATHTARVRAAHEWRVRHGLSGDASIRYTGNAPLIGIPSGAPITGPFSTESGIIGRQGALLSVDTQLRLAVTRELEASGGVNNLLNQQPELWTPAFARQVYVGLRWRWSAASSTP